MRLASLSPAAARQQRQDRLRRDRAAAQAIRAAFPTIGRLRLDLRFEGTGSSTPASQSHVMHPPARAFFEFPCPYADCDGQFDLTAAVKAALGTAAKETVGAIECPGLRARDHATKQPCKLHLHFTITPEYQRDT
ncbi:MAG: hypothetical protein ACREVV_02710 [Steroidobacteraceae bacterium]